MITKPKKAIIMDANTKEYMKFQFNPTPVNEEISVEFKEMKSPGLPHPSFMYSSGNADSVSFDIQLDDKGMYEGYTGEFLNFIYRFRPTSPNPTFTPPPAMLLSYGGFVKYFLVERMNVERNGFNPTTLKVNKATVKMELKTLPY